MRQYRMKALDGNTGERDRERPWKDDRGRRRKIEAVYW